MTSKKRWLSWGSRKSAAPEAPPSSVFSAHIEGEASLDPEPRLTSAPEGTTPVAGDMTAAEGVSPAAEGMTPSTEGASSAGENASFSVEDTTAAEYETDPGASAARSDSTTKKPRKRKWLPWGSRKSAAPEAPPSSVFSAHVAGEVALTPEPSTTPAAEVTTPAEEVITPAAEVITPAEEVITPAAEVTTPAEEVITPAEESVIAAEEVITPAAEVITPAEEVITPAAEVITPAEEVITPAAESITPAEAGIVPGESTARSSRVSRTRRKKGWIPSWASRSAVSTAAVGGAFSAQMAGEVAATSGPGTTPVDEVVTEGATATEDGAHAGESTASAVDSEETSSRRLFKGRRKSSRRPAVGGGLMRPFNLLPKQEVVEKTPTVGIGRLAAIGAVVVGIVGLGVWYSAESQSLGNAESDRDDLVELLEQPAPAAGGASVGQAERALFADQLLRTDAIASVLNERVAWDRVLTSVSRVFPEGVWFTGMTASAPPVVPEAAAADDAPAPDPVAVLPRLSIAGFAEDHEQLAVLMGRLSALRELEDVQLESSGSTLIGTTDAVQFSVSAAVTRGRTS